MDPLDVVDQDSWVVIMSEEGQIRDCEEASEAEEGEVEPYLEEGESSTKLLERLKELEAENSALALANESQREAYERCLDEVANHVVQALLNQKDLREECIKLKMRVFELERQNQTLSELLHQKLHSHLGPCQQRQGGPILEHSPKTPPAGSDMPAGSTCQMSTKSDGEHTRNGAPGARGPALSMDALSPFFQKKAHILEVLRKLEETDPLKFHPSAGLSSYCDFSQALFSADTTFNTANCPPQLKVCWPLCLHSCSDSAVRDGKGAVPGAGPEVCRPCLLLAHRSLEELLTRATAHSTGVEVLDSLAWPETKVAPVANSAGVSQSRTHMHSLSAGVCALPAENRYEEHCGLLKPGGANPHLCSQIREADRNGFAHREPEPELPVLEEVQSSTRPCKKGSCNRPPSKPSPGDPNAVTAPLGKDEKPTAAVAFQSLAVGPEECFFSMAAEVAKVKNSLYAATSSLPVPACARVAYCKQEADRPAYNGLSFSSNESCTSKKVAVEPYVLSAMPEKGGPTKQLSHKCKPVLIATSPSCLNESKPSPISSPSRLLKFLKIPSIGERAQAANPLRLSPQLTRSSKIPCRSNNYEVYHSPTACRAATTAEKSRQPPLSSSPKMDLCPATQSTPPFVPKPEDASTPPTKDTGYSSHSPPKAGQNMGASPNSQSQPPRVTQKVPHYENVSELAVPHATPHFLSGPEYEDPLQERRLSPPGEEGSRNVDTPTAAPPCGTKPAGRGDGEEGVALYQLHSHRSLPISAAIHKVQSSCSHSRASSSQYVAEGTDPYAAPKKPPTGKLLGEAGHQPFQERLAALGKLKSAEDLRIGGGRPGSEEDKELRNESRATVNDERNKTAERQSERNIDKEGGTKYTNSLDGKPYPKARLGDDLVKLPGPCLAYEPGSSLSADRVEQDAPPPRTCATKMAESPNIKAGLQNSNPDTPQVLLNYVKSTATHNPAHNGRAVSGPHNSPSKAQSKPGQSSAQPGTAQPFQAERSASPVITPAPHQKLLCRPEDRSMHTASKKKGLAYVESLPPPPPRPAEAAVERKALPMGPQSAIEQKVMKGIEENVLKLQVQDRGQPAEAKQRTSNGIASWFGLRKSKLPALSRKPDTGRPKEDRKEWRLVPSSSSFTSSSGSSSKTASKKKVETEGLNISKLMEKAEDLRKALEEEQAYVKGVALERPSRGHSCEVVMNQAQGQLSVMYRGVASDTFMQQLLHRVDVKDGGGDMLQAHRRLSFDSKKSRPVFGQQRNGIIVTSRSRDVTETGAELASNDDVTADKGLVVSMNPQHFEGCGASTHTLDSGIGTFPLPEYTGSAAGKSIPKARPRWEQDSHGKQGPATKVPRKARTLDKELTSLEEDCSKQGSPSHGSGPESKGSNSRPPATIHEDEDTSKPSKNWTFPHLKVSAVPVEMYLGVNEEVGTGGPGSPFRGLFVTSCDRNLL